MVQRGQDIETRFFPGTRKAFICHMLVPLSASDRPVPCVQKGGQGPKPSTLCQSVFPLISAETHEKRSSVGKSQMLIQAADTDQGLAAVQIDAQILSPPLFLSGWSQVGDSVLAPAGCRTDRVAGKIPLVSGEQGPEECCGVVSSSLIDTGGHHHATFDSK